LASSAEASYAAVEPVIEFKMSERAVLRTGMGEIEIEFDRERAPVTVENFVNYVKEGFFDGTVFHRVIRGFVIQGGGHLPDGSMKETRSPIKLESKNGLNNDRGTLSMARTNDPDSATSQFFINLVDNASLNPGPGNEGYAVFGKVVAGMDIVDRVANLKVSSRGYNSDWPVIDVVVEKAYMK